MDSFFVLLHLKKLLLFDFGGQNKTKNVDFLGLVIVAN